MVSRHCTVQVQVRTDTFVRARPRTRAASATHALNRIMPSKRKKPEPIRATLRCLFVVTKHDNATEPFSIPPHPSCKTSKTIVVCKGNAPPDSACTMRLSNTGDECHSVLRVLVDYHASFSRRADPLAFDRLVSIPGSASSRSPTRYARLGWILKSMHWHSHYYDATGIGQVLRPNLSIGSWKSSRLTPATPRRIGHWISKHIPGTRVCRMLASQGIFSVGGEVIARRSASFYEDLLAQVASCNKCEACHYLERMWHAVFASERNGVHLLCGNHTVPTHRSSKPCIGCGEVVGRRLHAHAHARADGVQ